jgi:acyl-CoA thioester hydrolase
MTDWDLPEPHLLEAYVEDSMVDQMGHMNNVEYLRLLERVAWDHSWALGVDWQLFERLNRGMVVRYTELDYLAPARPGDHLELATWIVENDNRISMMRRYQIKRQADGVTVLRGRTRFVCIAIDSGKPRRMPPEFINAYKVTAQDA